jgi:hypothetical protein
MYNHFLPQFIEHKKDQKQHMALEIQVLVLG